MMRLLTTQRCTALLIWAALGISLCHGQTAAILRAQAETESNQEKQVMLLCKAADLDPSKKEYRRDCDISKAALISSDKQALKTAQEASDGGQPIKAKRYAKYVSSLDPDLHRQAEQLLAKLSAGDAAGSTTTVVSQTQAGGPNQSALLAQAQAAFDSGNLQGARAGVQGITDPNLKPLAARILNDIDRYTGYVATGQQHEHAKEYGEAESSYRSALQLNAHIGADDLAGKAQRMHQAAVAAQVVDNFETKPPQKNPAAADAKGPKPPPEASPEEKKKRWLDESALAMSRNDLDTAGRKFKQVLDLDPSNADAKRGLADITAALSKDPVRLEKTLREAIVAFYASHFEDAESRFNRYLGADGGRKKGAAYFYLGATEATLATLDDASKKASRTREAREDFKQARQAGYQPIDKYVSSKILGMWNDSGT